MIARRLVSLRELYAAPAPSLLDRVEAWYFDPDLPDLIPTDLDVDDDRASRIDDARFEMARRNVR